MAGVGHLQKSQRTALDIVPCQCARLNHIFIGGQTRCLRSGCVVDGTDAE